MCKELDNYIHNLTKFLLADHPAVRGFTRIRDLVKKGEAPAIGILYMGRRGIMKHDMTLYSINGEHSEFPSIPNSRNFYTCLVRAVRAAEKIKKPPHGIQNLLILPLDAKAVEELRSLEKVLNGRRQTVRGHNVRYVSVPLTEQIIPEEEIPSAVPESYPILGTQEPVSEELLALKRSILARYSAERAAAERFCAKSEFPQTGLQTKHIPAP